jgi:hypothetical protein
LIDRSLLGELDVGAGVGVDGDVHHDVALDVDGVDRCLVAGLLLLREPPTALYLVEVGRR